MGRAVADADHMTTDESTVHRLHARIDALDAEGRTMTKYVDTTVAAAAGLIVARLDGMDKALLLQVANLTDSTALALNAINQARDLQAVELARRLEILNHSFEREAQRSATYVPREVQDKRNEQMDERVTFMNLAIKECLPHIDFEQHLAHLVEKDKEVAAWRLAVELRVQSCASKDELKGSEERNAQERSIHLTNLNGLIEGNTKRISEQERVIGGLVAGIAGEKTGGIRAQQRQDTTRTLILSALGVVVAASAIFFGVRSSSSKTPAPTVGSAVACSTAGLLHGQACTTTAP